MALKGFVVEECVAVLGGGLGVSAPAATRMNPPKM